MTEYKPALRTQLAVVGSLLAFVLPAITLSGAGYIRWLEQGLKLDFDNGPADLAGRLRMLAAVVPIIPVMLAAILAAGIPWMFAMARLLPLQDIQYYNRQNYNRKKGSRVPLLSKWLDRVWARMIRSRMPPGADTEPDVKMGPGERPPQFS